MVEDDRLLRNLRIRFFQYKHYNLTRKPVTKYIINDGSTRVAVMLNKNEYKWFETRTIHTHQYIHSGS